MRQTECRSGKTRDIRPEMPNTGVFECTGAYMSTHIDVKTNVNIDLHCTYLYASVRVGMCMCVCV